jgi:hypothetical protein
VFDIAPPFRLGAHSVIGAKYSDLSHNDLYWPDRDQHYVAFSTRAV